MNFALLTEPELNKRFDSLPDNIWSLLESEELDSTITQICSKNYLKDEDRIVKLKQLVLLVLLGFIKLDGLVVELESNLHINPSLAAVLNREINKAVFEPIRGDLEKIYQPPQDPFQNIEESLRLLEEGRIASDKSAESASERVTVAPPPPPLPPLNDLQSKSSGEHSAPQNVLAEPFSPKKSYTPPPPPAAGKSFEPLFGGGTREISDLKSKVKVIGGTHDVEEKEEAALDHSKPFVLHRETSLDPVSKNLPYAVPPKEPGYIPRPDLVARAKFSDENLGGKAQSSDPWAPPKAPPQQSAKTPPESKLKQDAKAGTGANSSTKGVGSSVKVVHYDEDDIANSKGQMANGLNADKNKTDVKKLEMTPKPKSEVQQKPAAVPLLPDKDVHKNESGPKVKGNTVDLR